MFLLLRTYMHSKSFISLLLSNPCRELCQDLPTQVTCPDYLILDHQGNFQAAETSTHNAYRHVWIIYLFVPINFCRLSTLPHHIGRLQKLKELHVRNNAIKYFPASIQRLQLYTFTAQNNNLIDENAAKSMTRSPSEIIPPLIEVAARCVVKHKVPIQQGCIPQHLEGTPLQLIMYRMWMLCYCRCVDMRFITHLL